MLVRLVLWLIVFFLGYTVFQAIKQLLTRPPAPPPEKTTRGEEMVRDPHCGTYVPRSDAVKAKVGGVDCCFCSTACRDAYLESR